MLVTKLLGQISFVFIIAFFLFGFWQWYRTKRKRRPD
jgi:O-antigen ligase